MTSRRGFLGALIAGLALDPERALFVPGKKLISIPRARPIWLNVGDVITFQSVYALNPRTGGAAEYTDEYTGRISKLRKLFVVTQNCRHGDIPTYHPRPIADGHYKDVSALPAGQPFPFEYWHRPGRLAEAWGSMACRIES